MTIRLGCGGIPMGKAQIGGADASAYHFKGSVETYADLPTNAEEGDVYNVNDTGKNYAWTGSEWDDLGGTVDLSSYYTKSETKKLLAEKQDKLTVVEPLTLENKVISSLKGFSYTADGSTVYSTTGTNVTRARGIRNPNTYFTNAAQEITDDMWAAYIDMPFKSGVVFSFPLVGHASIFSDFFFGKQGADGFEYISSPFFYNFSFSSKLYVRKSEYYSNTWVIAANADTTDRSMGVTGLSASSSGRQSKHMWTITEYTREYVQYVVNDDNSVDLWVRDNTTDTRIYKHTYSNLSQDTLNRIKEIDTVRIIPHGYYTGCTQHGVNASSGYKAEYLKVLDAQKMLYEYASEDELLAEANLFDISGQQAHNYLELSVDNQTIQVNSSGQLCANLDELGNEVNDISSRVTTAEGEIDDIQADVLELQTSVEGSYDLVAGDGITITEDDTAKTTTIANSNPTPYTLPTASADTLGGVKVDGTTITITDGVISAAAADVDTALSTTSSNAIANSAVATAINELDTAVKANAADIATLEGATVDTELSTTSTNAIANSAVATAINELDTTVKTNTSSITTLEGSVSAASTNINGLGRDVYYQHYGIDPDSTSLLDVSATGYITVSTGATFKTPKGSFTTVADKQVAVNVGNYILIHWGSDFTESKPFDILRAGEVFYQTEQPTPTTYAFWFDGSSWHYYQTNWTAWEDYLSDKYATILCLSDSDGNASYTDYVYRGQSSASVTVDSELSTDSENPVQNKVIAATINEIDASVMTNAADIATIENRLTTDESATLANSTKIETLENTATLQGNTFNGASQLVQLDTDGKLPALDGSALTNISADAPSNMVTTDTEQTITGAKTFSGSFSTTGNTAELLYGKKGYIYIGGQSTVSTYNPNIYIGSYSSKDLVIGNYASGDITIGENSKSAINIGRYTNSYINIGNGSSKDIRIGQASEGTIEIGYGTTGSIYIGEESGTTLSIGKSSSSYLDIKTGNSSGNITIGNSAYTGNISITNTGTFTYNGNAIATSADIEEIETRLTTDETATLTNSTNISNLQDGTGFTSTGTTAIANMAMPSGTYVDLTLGASGTTYTAPADGYVAISKSTSGDQYITLAVMKDGETASSDITKRLFTTTNTITGGIGLYIPIKKGTTYSVLYSASGGTNFFRFIYAVGSEPESTDA